jgi:hypothetical protein
VEIVVFDFLPEEQLRTVVNLADFCGMLVFDKWTCNTNGRQAIFFRQGDELRARLQEFCKCAENSARTECRTEIP